MKTIYDKATQILAKKYEEGRQRNVRWSQRAFAKKIGLSSGALSDILKGNRTLTAPIKKKLAPKLQLSPQEQIDFFAENLPLNMVQKRLEYVKLSNDQFHLISDWWHFAILNLLKTRGFKAYPLWIAKRLSLPTPIVQQAWDRLFRLGHLEKNGHHKVVRRHPRVETTDDLLDVSIQKSHLEDLKLIENSILERPVHLRDHTSMTLAINKKDIPKAKEMIRIFQDNFSEQIERDPGDEVYKLSISFFALTHDTETP